MTYLTKIKVNENHDVIMNLDTPKQQLQLVIHWQQIEFGPRLGGGRLISSVSKI